MKRKEETLDVFNPLSNKQIVVKYIMKHKAGITDKNHLIYGSKLEIATDKFAPMMNPRTGVIFDPFTTEEREFVAQELGIEPKRLSPNYIGDDNFWNDYYVILGKSGDVLDLRQVSDFIKYKVLLTNKGKIAPSFEDRNKKPSYSYYLIDKALDVDTNTHLLEEKEKAYVALSNISSDKYKLAYVVWQLTKKSMALRTDIKTLKAQLNNKLESSIPQFNKILSDKLFDAKVLIHSALMHGVISRKNNEFFLEGKKLADDNQSSNLENSALYLSDPVNQETKFLIEERIKISNE